ncbi:hypothetical protein RRG08_038659 [Elysia crispata]|uniref:Uncharacterized protein n=1 Tax=Elysia crispata TaxID=231223 RepID=A0AAE1AFU7_9GAST|nr:hypothetical protein RRG08_038659 [Elysia crispata]
MALSHAEPGEFWRRSCGLETASSQRQIRRSSTYLQPFSSQRYTDGLESRTKKMSCFFKMSLARNFKRET